MIDLMMSKEIVIPAKGHFLREESEILPEYLAFERVQTGTRRYTMARREAGSREIRLFWHRCECAGCFQTFFPPFLTLEGILDKTDLDILAQLAGEPVDRPLPLEEFFNWALQLTLPGLDNDQEDFVFFELPDRDDSLICPHCEYTTRAAARTFINRVESGPFLTVVTQTLILGDGRAAVLPYGNPLAEPADLPLKAQVVFDHKNRQTAFMLFNNREEIIEHSVLDEQCDPLNGYAFLAHINAGQLKTALAEAFGRFYRGSIPFDTDEITLNTFVLLNRFQGYPKDFYNAIPFAGNTRKIDGSFHAVTASLMAAQYKDIDTVYRRYGLPDKKSIRKAVFQTPALLFYAEELAALPFRNVDVFLQILQSDDIFYILSKLHLLPGILVYLAAMVNEKGEANAWAFVKKIIDFLEDAASIYLLSPPENKRPVLRKTVKELTEWHYNGYYKSPYNLPVIKKSAGVPDSRVDEYDFRALKNTFEYREAGIKLRNCLARYRYHSGQVFIIEHNHRPLAALEVCGEEIVHAFLAENESVQNDERLYAVLVRWAEINRLKVSLSDDAGEYGL